MKVIIGGAGITGLAVGYYLQQKRIDFEIYEEFHNPSFSTTGIQLASNCHFVFKELGIYDQIKEASIEKKTLMSSHQYRFFVLKTTSLVKWNGIKFILRDIHPTEDLAAPSAIASP